MWLAAINSGALIRQHETLRRQFAVIAIHVEQRVMPQRLILVELVLFDVVPVRDLG
jgi:hypothetical protein